jgi:predicted Zn-dependent protease
MSEEPRLSYDATSQGQRIDFAAERPRILTIAFAVFWLAGWLLLLVLTALDYLRFGSANLVGIVVLVAGGPPVALALLWTALGKRESLIVTPSELLIYRWVGPIRLPRSIDASTVMGLRAAIAPRGVLSDFTAVRTFYSGGCGSVAIDTTDRTLSVGHTLSAETASQFIEHVRPFIPQLSTRSTTAAIPRRRTIDYAAGFMTVTMIGFAFNVPTRLAITDRPICFYDDTVVPTDPIDVSSLRPAGRVYLVPIENFPVDRATAIARHFRTRFGVAIDVAPAVDWPEGAYVESRRQMNSAMMLTRLESAYATTGEPVVVIGLTTRDMFNPDVRWRYVFSYRRRNRVAVVSPARMDRGCMGVFETDDGRMMARLRKMVGKNIGIMYFGLEMSADPASMLYANIGGPQELDAMSEQF